MKSPHTKPSRKQRKDCFFGLHFDFHAGPKCTEVGGTLTPRLLDDLCRRVKPDFLQCDCKGHSGYSSYPTRVGNPAPGFVRDPLKIWRSVTARHGIALYMHYSGVWDSWAVKHRPTWAVRTVSGKRDVHAASVFGPYVDRLMIPQFKELIDDYDVDGVWVDGDSWGTELDYSRSAQAWFRKRTGLRAPPTRPDHKHFPLFMDFCREGFREYLRHYVDSIHTYKPHFQICSNWAFSSHMPEPVSAGVDFLSGDFFGSAVNSARMESRWLQQQGLPWDLMAWSFSLTPDNGNDSLKGTPQLLRELAVVLAAGGGVQVYFQQKRDASIMPWQMGLAEEAARFCRARQTLCHKATPVHEIAVLHDADSYYRNSPRAFAAWAKELRPMQGILAALLDSQRHVEVTGNHHLAGRMSDYAMIVIPECTHIPALFRNELLTYVRKGGSLLIIGAKAVQPFSEVLGVELHGEPAQADRWLEHNGMLSCVRGLWQKVIARKGTRVRWNAWRNKSQTTTPWVAATTRAYGKGVLAGIYANIGEYYHESATYQLRDAIGAMADELAPNPTVRVLGSHTVDVNVNRTHDGCLAINLVNTSGPHANLKVISFDEVAPIGPLEIAIRCRQRPSAIRREPEGDSMPFTFTKGHARLVLPRLHIHSILRVE